MTNLLRCKGMNLNVRAFGDHVQQEPTYFSSFSAELEFCSSVMWSFLQHLREPALLGLSQRVVALLLERLATWLRALGPQSREGEGEGTGRLTFHLPLHRYLAAFVHNAVYQQESSLEEVLGGHGWVTLVWVSFMKSQRFGFSF